MYDKTHVTRLWCPSICNKLFEDQPQNNYALLEKTTAQQILEFPGSTREILSLIRSRWTLKPNDRRCPDTKEYPTKVSWSLMKRSTRLSSCPRIRNHGEACHLLWSILHNTTSQCPQWNKKHLTYFSPWNATISDAEKIPPILNT